MLVSQSEAAITYQALFLVLGHPGLHGADAKGVKTDNKMNKYLCGDSEGAES